jgi:hypothetical protein
VRDLMRTEERNDREKKRAVQELKEKIKSGLKVCSFLLAADLVI